MPVVISAGAGRSGLKCEEASSLFAAAEREMIKQPAPHRKNERSEHAGLEDAAYRQLMAAKNDGPR